MNYDIIIAGGGMSGILSAIRLKAIAPDLKIAMVDKEEKLGGRLRTPQSMEDSKWSCGLEAISKELYDYFDKTLRSIEGLPDIADYRVRTFESVGILSGSRNQIFGISELFKSKVAKAIAGLAASREWPKLEEFFKPLSKEYAADTELSDKSFSHEWKATRKSATSIVIDTITPLIGIPSIWDSSSKCFFERSRYIQSGLQIGFWDRLLNDIVLALTKGGFFTALNKCQIIDAKYDANEWLVKTERGDLKCQNLLVAHSPWDALMWLPQESWPGELLSIATKAQPVSAVVLTCRLKATAERNLFEQDLASVPDATILVSERVQVIKGPGDEVCFQVTIPFEMSLDNPEVVKAIKKLKRAKRKFLSLLPNAEVESDYIALVTSAWTIPVTPSEHKYLEKLDFDKLNQKNLCFCGDAYGFRYDNDKNIIESVRKACDTILSSLSLGDDIGKDSQPAPETSAATSFCLEKSNESESNE